MKTMSASALLVVMPFLLFGAAAQAFQAPDVLTGKMVQVPETGDRVQVVAFLSAKCPCSAGHEPVLERLYQEFSKDFKFFGVHSNQNEDSNLTRKHFSDARLPFPVLEDRGARIAEKLGALKTPHVFVLRGDQVLYQGGVDDTSDGQDPEKHYLREALSRIREGNTPEVTNARVLGCAIRKSRS
ncbi:thioredoxin family protein [bacterium]|nr:thioredoxin family protein [bacterium]